MKITKISYAKPDDPIYKSDKAKSTNLKKKDELEAEYDKTLPSCETERFDE